MAQGGNSLVTLGILAVVGYFAYEYFFAAPATAAAPAAAAPPTPPAGTGASSAMTLDGVYTQLKALAAPDPNYTGTGDNLSGTPYHWQTDLNVILPNNNIDLSTLFPNIDLTQPMTAASFWATVGPYLHTHLGLSAPGFGGLGLAGLGALIRRVG